MYRPPSFKYIVVYGSLGEEMIFFSEASSHREVAAGRDVVSAGFLLLEITQASDGRVGVNVQCYGESHTLGIGSRERDTDLARAIFRNDY